MYGRSPIEYKYILVFHSPASPVHGKRPLLHKASQFSASCCPSDTTSIPHFIEKSYYSEGNTVNNGDCGRSSRSSCSKNNKKVLKPSTSRPTFNLSLVWFKAQTRAGLFVRVTIIRFCFQNHNKFSLISRAKHREPTFRRCIYLPYIIPPGTTMGQRNVAEDSGLSNKRPGVKGHLNELGAIPSKLWLKTNYTSCQQPHTKINK